MMSATNATDQTRPKPHERGSQSMSDLNQPIEEIVRLTEAKSATNLKIESYEIPLNHAERMTLLPLSTSQHLPPSYEETVGNVLPIYTSHYSPRPVIEPCEFYQRTVGSHFSAQTPPLIYASSNPIPNESKPEEKRTLVNPYQIVKELVNLIELKSDARRLARILTEDYDEILKIIRQNHEVFRIMDDHTGTTVVELCPSAEICRDHLDSSGCLKQSCANFHICPDYVNETCRQKNCAFGHSWKSNHNNSILCNLFLDELPIHILNKVLKRIFRRTLGPTVCYQYQQQKCQLGDRCGELHICYSYVKGLGICPNVDHCNLNHNIRAPQCKVFLEKLGISLNESPRDILKIIVSKPETLNGFDCNRNSPNLPHETPFPSSKKQNKATKKIADVAAIPQKNTEAKRKDKKTKSSTIIKNKDKSEKCKKKVTKKQEKNAAISQESLGSKIKIDKAQPKDKKNENKSAKSKQGKTIFAWHFHGSVESPLVCLLSLEEKCPYVEKGCKFLHAKKSYHWQFGSNNKWYNFHPCHVGILESSFRDVNCDQTFLPKLSPENVSKEMKDLFSLLGYSKINIDFRNMLMICQSPNKSYSIRHLVTATTSFNWYYRNNHGSWELYDIPREVLDCMEKKYLEYNEKAASDKTVFHFSTPSFQYEIDFSKMIQKNLNTKHVREVRRRPIPLSDQKRKEETNASVDLPKQWGKMKEEEVYKLMKLDPATQEYKSIQQIIRVTHPLCNIASVIRVQNPRVWKNFKNKESELKNKYNEKSLNISKLFVGIHSAFLDDICKDNFDWRKHDQNKVRWYGQGAYFYNSVAEVSQKCDVDTNGLKKLLVADVILGKLKQGEPLLTQDEENPSFNTAVDNVTIPTVFVKYNKNEYYPSHVVEFE